VTLLQAIILGAVQGLTEFIPISSSGHLLLISWLFGWSPPPLTFDVAVHWGTVLSVLAFFWRDWDELARAGVGAVRQRSLADPKARLLGWVVIAAIPAGLAGYFFEELFERTFKAPVAVAVFLLVTAALLTLGERLSRAERHLESLNWPTALAIGLAQAIAIFPGISRSGATIAAGRWWGMSREAAARFSFLLATPTILGAAIYKMGATALVGTLVPQIPAMLGGLLMATAVGYVCIRWLMRYLQRGSLRPFAIYCALVGLGWLALAAALGQL
jgi:undecaprenyl-diphosphatase